MTKLTSSKSAMTAFRHRAVLIGAVIIGIASAGLTLWLMSVHQTSQTDAGSASAQHSYAAQTATPPLQDPALVEQFAQMQRQIDAMQKRMANMGKNLRQENTRQLNTATTPTNVSKQQAGPPTVQQDNAGDQAGQQQISLIADRFQDEEANTKWAGNVAGEIQDAFLSGDIAGNSSLNNIDCRSSTCKLEVSFKDRESLDSIKNMLVEKVGTTLPYGAMQPGISGTEVTIYLGKNSATFAP